MSNPQCTMCVFGHVTKHGLHKGAQRYYCKRCKRSFMADYVVNGRKPGVEQRVIFLARRQVRPKDIAYLLQINVATAERIIRQFQRAPLPDKYRHWFPK